MPAVVKNNKIRESPYDRPSQENNVDEVVIETVSQVIEEAKSLESALEEALPQRPQKHTFIDFRTLPYEVLSQCLKIQQPKDMEAGKISFVRFDLKLYCELTKQSTSSFDLRRFGNGNLAIRVPYSRTSFGISDKYANEKTGKPKYSLWFSLYNPEEQELLDELTAWIDNVLSPVLKEQIATLWVEFGQDPKLTAEKREITVDTLFTSPLTHDADDKYKPTLKLAIKTMKEGNDPVVTVWNKETETTAPWSNVVKNTMVSAVTYLESIMLIQKSFYPRLITNSVQYYSAPSFDSDAPVDLSFPGF